MMKKALIFEGGWDGHEPKLVSARFARLLEDNGFSVQVSDSLTCLENAEKLTEYDVILPMWTMGEIPHKYVENVSRAVAYGAGLAGVHGGMCDAFRQETEWQFMTGGQWVSHPGGDGMNYTVNIHRSSSPITQGIEDFAVCSEQYYLHIDPSIEVLATTRFPLVNYYHASNKTVDMPVAWTKYWGVGRVFYCSLGHHDDVFDRSPDAQTLVLRGILWASEGKAYASENGLSGARYENSAKMY